MDDGDANLAAYLRFATAAKGGTVIEGEHGFGFAAPFPLRHPMVTGWFGEKPEMNGRSYWHWRLEGEGDELPALAADAMPDPRGEAEPIATLEQAREYVSLLERCYQGIPEGMGDMIFLPPEAMLAPPVTAYGIWKDGGLVSAAIAFTTDVCGLYWVATDPAHEGHGYGPTAALHAARASGLDRYVCQASKKGLPLWEKLGMRRTHTYYRTLVNA